MGITFTFTTNVQFWYFLQKVQQLKWCYSVIHWILCSTTGSELNLMFFIAWLLSVTAIIKLVKHQTWN